MERRREEAEEVLWAQYAGERGCAGVGDGASLSGGRAPGPGSRGISYPTLVSVHRYPFDLNKINIWS